MNPKSTQLLTEGRSAQAIAADLRREFESAFLAAHGTRPERDPMLSVLFHALATQVARVYSEAEQVFPERVIDDLVASLGLPYAAAVPAQCAVAFRDIELREYVTSESTIIGYSQSGEEVRFALDVPITLVPAVLRFAGIMESGKLRTIAGASLDANGTPFPHATVPCPMTRAPTLYLAIECEDGNLGDLGIHFDSQNRELGLAIARSPWHLLSHGSVVHERGTMVSTSVRGGVRKLMWVTGEDDVHGRETVQAGTLNIEVAEGPAGHQCFILPPFPQSRRHACLPPQNVRDLLPRLVAEEFRESYAQPLIWLVVPLPAGRTDVAVDVQTITLNATTASNVEIISEHVGFERGGSVVSVRPEGWRDRFLLGAQTVLGETNTPYVDASSIDAPEGAGRFRIDGERVFVYPARSKTGRTDTFADLRLVFTDGDRGNGVDAGRVTRVVGLANATAQVTNLTRSRGGTNPPDYRRSRLRLAEALRSRDRPITRDDFEVIARALEPRIRSVAVDYRASISDRKLQPIHRVRATVSRRDFSGDTDAEYARLASTLESHLQARALIGQVIKVELDIVT